MKVQASRLTESFDVRTLCPARETLGYHDGLADYIGAHMAKTGLPESAGRTSKEIARRLIEKAELRSVRLADEALNALKTFLAIRAPLRQAGNALRDFAGDAGISLGVKVGQCQYRILQDPWTLCHTITISASSRRISRNLKSQLGKSAS